MALQHDWLWHRCQTYFDTGLLPDRAMALEGSVCRQKR